MEKQFLCYQRAHNAVINVSCYDAADLLINHLNRNGIKYYRRGIDGRSVELYYRLRNTGFRIQQSIYIGAFTYHCTTSVAECPLGSEEKQLELLSWVCLINKGMERGSFHYDYRSNQLQYHNHMSLHPHKNTVNMQKISERFDEFISRPHYVLDVEYADFLLQVLK